MYAKRIQKEIQKLGSGVGIDIFINQPINNLETIYCTLHGARNTIYSGEQYLLKFTFSNDYPLQSPEVVFVPPHVPLHEHVYTNGHICLNILYDGWTPVMNIQSVCMSIQSMLSSATQKKKPIDNDTYVMSCSHSPKNTRWNFHDDKV
ncbi:predicted protein [Naegleria gruberi]|uniref:Predicted protein n=1 Tax=Naegleria gruberi TaxID=5762 RepID=D2VZY6_NAEGR|nr:uncharacterized protein NAEGRDRAFT_44833 [Naegleria gruberi]EFC37650.1 predicted protein [Naegleria gruberi]|eukprot:XP_002670394.1 predicted protein [Naegleria gruberi strain NEG-M]